MDYRALIAFAGLAVLGCGSDSPPEPDPVAIEKCETLRTTWCAQYAECQVSQGVIMEDRRAGSAAACEARAANDLDCERATSVSSSYDRCLQDIPTVDCSAVVAREKLPSSCVAVIKIHVPN